MDDKQPVTAVAREPDAGASCHRWATDHWALHLPGWLTIEQQEQLVAEHNSWSLGDDHQRPTALFGGHSRTADPRTGLRRQHLTVTIWTSG